MANRLGMAMAMGALLTACGGGSGQSNAAVGKAFSYGQPVAASTAQATAVQGSVSGALALQSGTAPDATQAQDLADISSITTALLGNAVDSSFLSAADVPGRTAAFVARRAGLAAPVESGFQDPTCVASTPTSVKLSGCQLTVVSGTTTTVVKVDGSFTVATDAFTWDLALQSTFSDSAPPAARITVSYHAAGTLSVTSTTAKGSLRRELAASASAGAQSDGLAVSESVDLDVTHAQGCVTGGTLEAKRVWTQRPSGESSTTLPDRGARLSWTACGVATLQLSQ